MNAYHNLPCYVDVYDKHGNFIGNSTGFKARCTATSPGSVQIKKPDNEEFWYSGKILPYLEYWKLMDL